MCGVIIATIAIAIGTTEIAHLFGGKWATIVGAAAWLLVACAAIISDHSGTISLKRAQKD